ncbi:MAG: energy transducer TonB [Pseudomonadales bacterium]|jgi:TonB family protein|nr:energy transducer TonB [Pseudomonadales bacterium]
MNGAFATADRAEGGSLLASFAYAALFVSVGVLASWGLVKRGGERVEVSFADDALPAPRMAAQAAPEGVPLLLEQAERAFASGRIVAPRFDNALYFYQAVLGRIPEQAQARAGLARVVEWLQADLDAAVIDRDWPRAEAAATTLAELRGGGTQAQLARVQAVRGLWDEVERVREDADDAALVRALDAYLEETPQDAAASAQRMAAIDALLGAANRALAADAPADAAALLADLRAFGATGADVDALAEQVSRAGIEDDGTELRLLAAADAALRAGRLMDAAGRDAFALYSAVLEASPGNRTAEEGLGTVRRRLVADLRAAIRDRRIDDAGVLLAQAERASVGEADLDLLRRDLDYTAYLERFERGQYDEVLGVTDLEVLGQRSPSYPRQARARSIGGWVEVEFTVDEEGRVVDVEASEASAEVFVEASLDAIRGWRFAPAELHGRPVPVRAAVRFTFRPD